METPAKDVPTSNSMKANKHTICFDNFLVSLFRVVNSQVVNGKLSLGTHLLCFHRKELVTQSMTCT
jgi:hypothetical protein